MVLMTCRYTTDMFGLNTGHCLHMCMICYVLVILTVRNVHLDTWRACMRVLPLLSERSAMVMHLGMCMCMFVCMAVRVVDQ